MVRICAVILLAFLFSSCSNKSKSNLAVFKAAEEGFLHSNDAIASANMLIYKEIDSKLTEPASAAQARIWQPKAILIKEKSTEIIKYLDSLTIALKKEAGLRSENKKEVYNEDDMEAVNRLFIDKKIGNELFEKLQEYKNDILAVDAGMDKQFRDYSVIITKDFDQAEMGTKKFATTFFEQVPAIAAVTMLKKFENNVRILEDMFINYCNSKIPNNSFNLMVTVPLINQSSDHIKGGEDMEIIAGVGAYYVQAQPQITINNVAIAFDNSQGFAKYVFKTPLKAGKYSIPVNVDYIDENGIKQFKKEVIEYSVIE